MFFRWASNILNFHLIFEWFATYPTPYFMCLKWLSRSWDSFGIHWHHQKLLFLHFWKVFSWNLSISILIFLCVFLCVFLLKKEFIWIFRQLSSFNNGVSFDDPLILISGNQKARSSDFFGKLPGEKCDNLRWSEEKTEKILSIFLTSS